MLELREIRKSYVTTALTQTALDGVSLSFRTSEFVAILGASGSGKTTMLNIIGGLDRFDSGDLVIDGISTARYRDRDWDAYRNNRIGFVFQSYNLIPHQTILANVELALTLSGVSSAERRERALRALSDVGLAEHVHKRPSQLSGGQMQRVAIARALINDPDIVLADEPTGALDSVTSVQVMELLQEVAHDRLVIMVTHNPDLAREYATRIVELSDGRIIRDSHPYEAPVDVPQVTDATKRTSMSPLTALGLSFTNLMTKKGRTLMTAFAGSIGIIGIALILALANGANTYIADTEERAMASYPLTVQKLGVDLSSFLASAGEETSGKKDEAPAGSGGIRGKAVVSKQASEVTSNDLVSFKRFLDENGGEIRNHVRTIEYDYGVKPRIFLPENTADRPIQVNPDVTFSSGGESLGVVSFSSDMFHQLASDRSLYSQGYETVAGRWPESHNELMLVVSEDGTIPDYLEYTMGLRDHREVEKLRESLREKKSISLPATETSWTPEQIMSRTFKRVDVAALYTYDDTYKVWADRSGDQDFLKRAVTAGEELSVVGIVKPVSGDNSLGGSSNLRPGLYYTPALTRHMIDRAAVSQIVKDQRENPGRNVFTGKTFAEEAQGQKNGLDLSSLFTVDSERLAAAFSFDPSALGEGLANLDFSSFDASQLGDLSMDMGEVDLSQLDLSSLPSSIDLSSLNLESLDFSVLAEQFPQLANVNYQQILRDAVTNGALKPGGEQAINAALTQVMSGFFPWYQQNPTNGTPVELAGAVARYLSDPAVRAPLEALVTTDVVVDRQKLEQNLTVALGADPALQQITDAVGQKLGEQITSQLGSALGQSVTQMMSQAMTQMMEQTMTRLMTSLQEQIASQIQGTMEQLVAGMSQAMAIDPEAFADVFQMNAKPEELAGLFASMLTPTATSADQNLTTLGYADESSPTQIDIYPKSFADKDVVKDIIEQYNQDARAAGQDGKVIAYTDLVGILMSSITSIITIISALLIAFVSISLVVSSIMIGIITFISVLERRKEIGILRSIGASKGDIKRVFNAETMIVGFLAGLIGVLTTVALTFPINAGVHAFFDVVVHAVVPLPAAVGLVLISVLLTFVAGLIPASRAAREDPVEALRSE